FGDAPLAVIRVKGRDLLPVEGELEFAFDLGLKGEAFGAGDLDFAGPLHSEVVGGKSRRGAATEPSELDRGILPHESGFGDLGPGEIAADEPLAEGAPPPPRQSDGDLPAGLE